MQSSKIYHEPSEEIDRIGKKIVDAAFHVHDKWGPGLLESFYQIALMKEILKRELEVKSEVSLPVVLDDLVVENAYKIDLLVENKVVVEIKTVEKLLPAHYKQLRTYLKLSNNQLVYLINFNVELIKDGINREIMSKNK